MCYSMFFVRKQTIIFCQLIKECINNFPMTSYIQLRYYKKASGFSCATMFGGKSFIKI